MTKHTTKLALVLLISTVIIFANPTEISASGLIEYYQKVNENISYIQTTNNMPGKGNFFLRRIVSNETSPYWTSFEIPGESGTLSYFDTKNQLIQVPLVEGNLPQDRILFLSTDQYHYIVGQPYTYRHLAKGTVEAVSTLPVQVEKDQDGWIVSFRYNLSSGVHGILWGAGSQNELVNLKDKDQLIMWSNYDLDKSARLLYEGYHYKSPTSYYPTTANSYWSIPSDYFTNSLIRSGLSPASELIGQSMLMVAHRNINEEGFLPTLPRSNWLYNDYGIESGFFDTRFNADTIETNAKAYTKFGNEKFLEVAKQLSDYYLEHGKNNHHLVNNPIIGEGWLVEDYGHLDGKKNHTSLNHQLQAIYSFLLLYEVEENPEYLDFAEKMLNAIKITRDKWIMPNGNLEYAYMSNGSMGLVDYPYLTYNDLLNVQEALVRVKGESDSDLDILIDTKKQWLDRNNIIGYRK